MNSTKSKLHQAQSAARLPGVLLLCVVLLAITVIAAACGGDDRNPLLPVGPATALPAPTAEISPTATQDAPPTPRPSATAAPTASPSPSTTRAPAPTPAPTSTAQPTPEATVAPRPTPAPTPEPTTEPTESQGSSTAGGPTAPELRGECLTDGSLTDPMLVLSCSNDAMTQLGSVTVDVDVNLGALLPGGLPADAQVPGIQMQITRVFPDDISVTMTGPDGEMVRLVLVDGATFVYDSASDIWVKLLQPQEDTSAMLLSLNMVEQQVQDLDNPGNIWNDLILSEDGSQYIVSYLPAIEQAGMQFPPAELELRVDTVTFLQHLVLLKIADADGMKHTAAEFRYSSHGELTAIEVPTEYIEADASLGLPPSSDATSGFQDRAYVVSLSKNSQDDVEVTFSEPVTVVGEIGLYVLDPSTGGWILPYATGDGTNTLTFSAAFPGNPPLLAGKSPIVGITFETPESDILNIDGQPVDSEFMEWIYPE